MLLGMASVLSTIFFKASIVLHTYKNYSSSRSAIIVLSCSMVTVADALLTGSVILGSAVVEVEGS